MRVSLLHNPRAGRGLSLDRVVRAIGRQGHELLGAADTHAGAEHLLADAPDVLVAAGGDGTVADAARMLAGRGVPLAILPLGTANNIARSLGLQGSIDDLVAAWHTARRTPLDLGLSEGPSGRRVFVEGVGAGLIPAAIADMDSRSDGADLPVPARLEGASRATAGILKELRPIEMTVVADGVRADGAFLLAEVLNIPSIAARLVFSTGIAPSDGLLDVVLGGEEHRVEITNYLQEPLEGRPALSLPSIRARQVTLEGGGAVHLDDEVLDAPLGRMSIRIETGVLDYLA